ncbi:MAG: hypothetical protein K6T61_01260 [Bryobacteraceae bacterium]|nr:hypothetical protein [Bryobacteraceae bacterium]
MSIRRWRAATGDPPERGQPEEFMMRAWLLAGLMALGCVAAAAADINGKWVAQVPGFQGDTMEITFNFKADGEKLTGTIGSPMGEREFTEGKISGENISFVLIFEPPGGENKFKITYKGKVAGDQIHITQTFEGGPGGGEGFPPVEYTAKRVK